MIGRADGGMRWAMMVDASSSTRLIEASFASRSTFSACLSPHTHALLPRSKLTPLPGPRHRHPQSPAREASPHPQAQEDRPRTKLLLNGRQVPGMLPDYVSRLRFAGDLPSRTGQQLTLKLTAPSSPTPPRSSSAATAPPSSVSRPAVRPS
jgi:hypothetical protein